ncbi:hypothetical protein [Pseudobacteroides cellulosolvens]|uniref:Uncharacterized protein n=1 Tax=Pseudobacteroides cellulosolvens ATCC 35603 = DSM 2933 TaxID=398512 RepID=A0A0L6JLH9_9FIRM|nr:hypothetical protein [Pseudobacteroides cellulosolvens]KNY26618.1 hypothetical protein Bccel_1883 [Pseudobacteroides cellulosolvens ATCC 35603 = DSM 2933]
MGESAKPKSFIATAGGTLIIFSIVSAIAAQRISYLNFVILILGCLLLLVAYRKNIKKV